MALRLEQKQTSVATVNQHAATALSLVAADYRGLTAADMTKLRAEAKTAGVKIKIVRNTLARRALQGTPYECMTETLVGPLLLAFSQNDPGASARLLRDFAKTNEKLAIQSLSLGGKLLGKEHINTVANLPTPNSTVVSIVAAFSRSSRVHAPQSVPVVQAKLARTAER